jgi:diaminopropionate ammonia-lyase
MDQGSRQLRFRDPRHVANVARRRGVFPSTLTGILAPEDLAAVRREIGAWPGYAPTPLRRLDGLAGRFGLGAIHYKDESRRFALESFKALGGALAVERLLTRLWAEVGRPEPFAAFAAGVAVTCATDGNHGRSVAWGARRCGCRCRIYIHATVSAGRRRAIEHFGAEVVRIEGNYDDSVRRAAEDAAAHGWHVVSDTSYPGYTEIPKDVMRGYMLMAAEAFDALAEPPSHVAVQGGVGGVAAAVLAVAWQRFADARPRFLVVEPEKAACIAASLAVGERVAVAGDLDTVMAGLACGEVSLVAWEILRQGVDDALVVHDDDAVDLMRLLADPIPGDPPLVAGESATCGLAGVLAAAERPALAAALGLDRTSRVLVFGTEGATDPDLYAELVGRRAQEIAVP